MTLILGMGALGILLVLASLLSTTKSDAESEQVDPQAAFKAALEELAKVRIDPDTGEPYAYKAVRTPAEKPVEKPAKQSPIIVEPMQGKAVRS